MGPACGHVVGRFAAPLHLLHPRCTAVRYWHGCIAWFLQRCVCPSCPPRIVTGPGDRTPCQCPPDTPTGLT